ncbi:tubulin-specific chaperone [Diaporthe amygdali]|uniref:tubulin-specific chaperone n=1 Tax=Phomopsis amygdali TaxID=1214568 RepID=UPI0022FDE50B|nr:tubulin-specific chaperone [Diaporthe amygdali]KAJ0121405.1 tubulin-specific chaperone [Diaporthe amygdali]
MAPPTPLAVATSSVQRLVKEEAYYHKDLASQQARIEKLEKDISEKSSDLDENAEYVLKQEKQAAEETKNVFGPLRNRITDAISKLEEQIAISESSGDDGDAAAAELTKAREVLKQGQDALKAEA